MRKFSLLATTAVAVAALSTTTAAQGRGTGKAPTAKAPNVSTSAPRPAVHRLTDHRAATPEARARARRRRQAGRRMASHTARRRNRQRPRHRRQRDEHVQWHDHDDGEHRHDNDSTAHVRAQCDLHEDLEEPQSAHQSEGDAADGDDDRGGQHRVPQSGTVHRGTERVEKPGARLRSAQRRDDCGWPQSRSGSKAGPDSSGTGTGTGVGDRFHHDCLGEHRLDDGEWINHDDVWHDNRSRGEVGRQS